MKKEINFNPLTLKYRPKNFKEFKKGGNDKIVKILKYAIKQGQLRHGYIFYGQHGTGKTSLARIFAKALNCENLSDKLEPCCECSNCIAIEKGTHFDVQEIDAASNRGIDNIRELQKYVNTIPLANVKVIILDEAHQISGDGFKALLKTLEEPNNNVIFILVTTNIDKIPNMIYSRCAPFEFQPATPEQAYDILLNICKNENIKYIPIALELLSETAQGSLRDIQRNLEMARDLGKNNITEDVVNELLGSTTDFDKLINTTLKHIVKGNIKELNNILWRMPTTLEKLKEFLSILLTKTESRAIKLPSENNLFVFKKLLDLNKDILMFKDVGIRKAIRANLIFIALKLNFLKGD